MLKRLPTFFLLLRMTRPGFLTASAVACLLGWAVAYASAGLWQGVYAAWTLLLALLLHAAANVINDAADAENGGDAINQDAIAPFSGGAGLLQAGRVTLAQTRALALALFALVLLGGLALASVRGWALLAYGAAGLLLAWAYSAAPLQLMKRGVGELAVAAAWLLMVGGADFVQRGVFSTLPLLMGGSYALLMANVLLVNGLPDATADAAVGKRTLVVRLGSARVPALYALLAVLAHGLALAVAWVYGLRGCALFLPQLTLVCACHAYFLLRRPQRQRSELRRAMVLTIAAAQLHACALAAGLLWQQGGV